MRKFVFVLGMLLSTTVTWTTPSCGGQLFAQSGCCKERKSDQNPWIKTGKSFTECETENNGEDTNVFEEIGLIWWDIAC